MLRKSTPVSRRWVAKNAAYHHTTHKLSLQKIHYRHHPFYGTEVEVVRALRRFEEESFVVKLPEGHQIAVPAWMFDPVFCDQLPQRDHPSIAQALPSSLSCRAQRCVLITDSESGMLRRGGIVRPEKKLASAETGLCEKVGGKDFPNPSVRCRELIVELLRGVIFVAVNRRNMSEKISVGTSSDGLRLHSAVDFPAGPFSPRQRRQYGLAERRGSWVSKKW
jgi:hypothetical protein